MDGEEKKRNVVPTIVAAVAPTVGIWLADCHCARYTHVYMTCPLPCAHPSWYFSVVLTSVYCLVSTLSPVLIHSHRLVLIHTSDLSQASDCRPAGNATGCQCQWVTFN